MDKINLLQIITGVNTGGAEKVVFDLTRKLDKDKYNVCVASLLEQGEMLSTFRNAKSDIVTGKLKRGSFKGAFKTISILKTFIKQNKIEVVHAHMFHALLFAVYLKLLYPKLKIVFTLHTTSLKSKLREIVLFCLKPFRVHDILFTDLEPTRFYNKGSIIIPNGIDVDIVQTSDISKRPIFTFICVGGFRPAKNYINFINSLVNVNFDFEYQILIAGKGDLEIPIKEAIKNNDLQDRIKLIGLRNDIPEILLGCHVFLMPSLWEGLPISILEAGSAKLPIIATPVGSIPILLDDNTGYLCKWQDFPTKMIEVYNNYEEAVLKGKNLSKRIIENYSLDTIVSQHDKLYSSL